MRPSWAASCGRRSSPSAWHAAWMHSLSMMLEREARKELLCLPTQVPHKTSSEIDGLLMNLEDADGYTLSVIDDLLTRGHQQTAF